MTTTTPEIVTRLLASTADNEKLLNEREASVKTIILWLSIGCVIGAVLVGLAFAILFYRQAFSIFCSFFFFYFGSIFFLILD